MLLAAKLLLAPGLVAVATLAGRRYGVRVAGWLGALPVVAAPILLIIAIDHGVHFGARAADTTLLGLVSLTAFIVAYARVAEHARWPVALAAGWAAFGVLTAAFSGLEPSVWEATAAALLSFVVGARAMPAKNQEIGSAPPPPFDILIRMAATAVLVLAITGAAGALGPGLAGLLTPFPIITAVLAAFTHAQAGGPAAAHLLRGLLAGIGSFAAFFIVVAETIEPLGTAAAFATASAVALAMHAVGASVAGVFKRTENLARVKIVDQPESNSGPGEPVSSKQSAELTLPRQELDKIWTPEYLERLARTYWAYITKMSLGLLRVIYGEDCREIVLLGRPLVLLRFHAPDYDADPEQGTVTWRIDRGILVAPGGRGKGFLRITVRRPPESETEGQDEITAWVSSEVSNFYPVLAGSGWFSKIGRILYRETQLRIHVLVTHGFLRSLARMELEKSKVGKLLSRPAGPTAPAASPDRGEPLPGASSQSGNG